MLIKKQWLLVVVMGVTAILLSACGGPDEHIWLKSPGWSRAVFLGETTSNDPVPVAIRENGNIYAVLLETDEETAVSYFHIKGLNRDADALWERPLTDLRLQRPGLMQLFWDDGRLHLFWIERDQLHMLELQSDGMPLGDPILLSEGAKVASYSVVLDSQGDLVLWYAGTRENPGVYALDSLDGSSQPLQIDAEGTSIQLRYDQADVLHASWAHYPIGYGTTEIVYAAYPSRADWGETRPVVLHGLSASPASSFEGPLLGVDEAGVYLFWMVVIRSGLEAGTIQTEFMYFPAGQFSENRRVQPVFMPSIYGLNHEYLPNTYLDAGERVDLQGVHLPLTGDVREINPDIFASEELAISFRSMTQYLWRKEQYQVNVAYFQDGEASSYQPLSFTSTFSMMPNLISSEQRHLYITWMEKQESGYNTVYFASTSPEIKDALSRSTGREFLRVVAQITFGMLVGILLAPIAGAAWAMAPLLFLFITAPLRKLGSQPVQRFFSIFSVLGAVIVYWLSKLVTLPGMMDYIPFSAWIPSISFIVGNILRWAVPGLISAIALFLGWYYTFRQSNPSTLYFLLIYIGIDALLTAAIYAVLIYGAI